MAVTDGAMATACPKSPALFATGMTPHAADADYLYGFGDQTIVRVGRSGGTPTAPVTGLSPVHSDRNLIVDDRFLFWSHREDPVTTIMRAPKAGGAATPLATFGDSPGYLPMEMDATRLYLVGRNHAVFALEKSGGAPILLATSIVAPDRIAAVDDHFVYWLGAGENEFNTKTLERAPKTGGAALQLGRWVSDQDSNFINDTASDETYIYLLSNGSVVRFAKANAEVKPLYGIPTITSPIYGTLTDNLVVVGGVIYWSSQRRDAIFAVDGPHYWLSAVNRDGTGLHAIIDSGTTIYDRALVSWGDSLYFSSPGVMRICR